MVDGSCFVGSCKEWEGFLDVIIIFKVGLGFVGVWMFLVKGEFFFEDKVGLI